MPTCALGGVHLTVSEPQRRPAKVLDLTGGQVVAGSNPVSPTGVYTAQTVFLRRASKPCVIGVRSGQRTVRRLACRPRLSALLCAASYGCSIPDAQLDAAAPPRLPVTDLIGPAS